MRWGRRFVNVALGLIAIAAGLVVGSTGCGWPCRCPELDPVEPGLFEIVASEQRPELVGGTVEARDDEVRVEFVDADGASWTIVYAVVHKTGG